MDLLKKCSAEVIGTFVLVLFGCGVAIWTGADPVATSLAFGLSIVAMAYSIGNISGCHVNPAVSLAMAIRKKISWKEFAFYVIAQLIGALIACLCLLAFFGKDCGFGANQVQDALFTDENPNLALGLLAEVILTFIFVLAIMGVTSKKEYGKIAGIVIGLALVLVHLLGLSLTGTSVNPARSLIPALFAQGDALEQAWIFIVAPLAGGALAAFCYHFLDNDDQEEE